MRFEETERPGEQRGIADGSTQRLRIEPGDREEPRGAGIVLKRPDERGQRQLYGIVQFFGAHAREVSRPSGSSKRVAKKVLVVEDNELNLRLFCDLLRAHDHEVEGVRDGREALETARRFLPDLIVMDIQMPHVTGLELTEAIRADNVLRATPIMAVTAYAGQADEERIRAAGADAYVSKPISLMRFIETVSGLLDRQGVLV